MRTAHARPTILLILALAAAMLGGSAATVIAATPSTPTYDAIPDAIPGNVVSVGYEATSTSEFGDLVSLAPGPRLAAEVDVLLSSWGCESGGGATCTTTPGATFSHPLTLTIYAVDDSGPTPAPGAVVATNTTTFAIPYRPSADPTCPGGTAWRFNATTCYNGLAHLVTFDLSSIGATLPTDLIWTVAYDTTHYGANPIGEAASCRTESGGCGYDSLNVGAESFAGEPSSGTDLDPDGAVLDSTWAGAYCDGGTGGTGTLRIDTGPGCWTDYRPLATIRTVDVLGACAVAISGTAPVTYTLLADCTTSTTVIVPQNADGSVFDGDGYTITAVDPVGAHFVGAVLQAQAGAKSITVKDTTITTSGLADVCDADAARLRGILFEGVAGSITGNTVTGLKQGTNSGCQEGNAIEARHEPFAKGGVDKAVAITGNTVTDHQKTGIVASGSVNATITGNVVTGAGPITYIGQNGIQVGFGATGIVKNNTVSANDYTPASFVACGLLFFDADGVKASANNLFANEKNQCNFGKGGGNVSPTP